MADNPIWKSVKPFVNGSLSGTFATCCIQPIDTVKVRIQLRAGTAAANGPLDVGRMLVREEGFGALYNGLSAAVGRQVVYTGARLGLFDIFQDFAKQRAGQDGRTKSRSWKTRFAACLRA